MQSPLMGAKRHPSVRPSVTSNEIPLKNVPTARDILSFDIQLLVSSKILPVGHFSVLYLLSLSTNKNSQKQDGQLPLV
jgi:hypothetical protein